jgi:hypothetical protein
METWIERRRGINAGIKIRGDAGIVNRVDLGSLHGGGNSHLRWKQIELLMCPYRPRRTAFNGTKAATQDYQALPVASGWIQPAAPE